MRLPRPSQDFSAFLDEDDEFVAFEAAAVAFAAARDSFPVGSEERLWCSRVHRRVAEVRDVLQEQLRQHFARWTDDDLEAC